MGSVTDPAASHTNGSNGATDSLQPITIVPAAKLRAPALPARLLIRSALLQVLAGAGGQRLIAISAAAGYGKSTLAALWLQETAQADTLSASAWLSLDMDDDDPLRFLLCLAAAVAPIVPGAAQVATSVAQYQSPRQALRPLLDALEAAQVRIRLVIDDLQRLRDPAAVDLLAAALERSPDNVQWMLLSRHAMPFSLGKLRLRGQVLELGTADLQLRRSDIEELLALNGAQQWDNRDIDVLVERTQGWITGIHLALLSARRHARGERSGQASAGGQASTVQDLLAHLRGDDVLLADYLTGELLSQQSERMRSFLLQCAVAERLQAGLCDAIRGEEDSAQLLEQAADEQLFLQPLDAHGEWYAFHQLFREMLLRYLRQRYAAGAVRELHLRAADWLLRQGEMVGALRTLLDGGEAELAADLVQSRSRAAVLQNNLAELQQWARLLPEEQIDARPQLLLDLAWAYSTQHQGTFAAILQRAARSLAALDAPPAGWRDELAVLGLLARFLSADQSGILRDCLAALKQFSGGSHFAAGWVYLVAGMVNNQHEAETPALTYSQLAAAAFARAGYAAGEIIVLGRLAALKMGSGDAEAALADCERALQLIEGRNCPNFDERLFFTFLVGEILFWQNRVEQAADRFRLALARAREYGEGWYSLMASTALHVCELASGRPVVLAQATLEEEELLWREIADSMPVGSKSQVVLWQMMRWKAMGEPQQAWRAFQRLGLTPESLAASTADNAWLALLTAYVMRGYELPSLTPILERQLRLVRAAHSRHVAIRLQLLLASQQQQLGEHNAARRALRQALHEAERTGYIRMVLLHPELAPALRVINTPYARQVLALLEAAPAAEERRPGLTEQEAAILALLGEGCSNEEIAERLVVTVSTVKWHLGNIYKKLGVKGRQQALAQLRAGEV